MSSFGGEAWWQDDRSLRAGGETTDEEGSTSRVDISLGTDDDEGGGRPWAESPAVPSSSSNRNQRQDEPSTTNLAQSRLDAQLKSLPLANQYGGQYDAISYEQRAPGEGEPSIKGDDQTVGSSLGGGPSITQSRSGGGASGVGGGEDSVAPYDLRGMSNDDGIDDGDSYGYGSSLMGGDDSAAEGSVPHSSVMNESIMNALGASGAGVPKTPPPKGSKSSKVKVKPSSSSSNNPRKPRAAPALVPSPTKTANTAASSSTELNAEEDPIGYAAGYAEGIKAARVEARRQRRRRFLILLLVLLALLVAAMIAVAAVTRFAFFESGQANGAQGAGGTETSSSSEGGRGGDQSQQGGSSGQGDGDSDDQGEEAVVPATLSPTISPTDAPTFSPTSSPVEAPTTDEPTLAPTTSSPTAQPTISAAPTTAEWANRPTTMEPTFAPTTMEPTAAPTTSSPTVITASPTSSPTASPTLSLPPTFPKYAPGELTETSQDGNLFLAGGLSSRVLASSKEFVSLKGGEQSGERYHSNVRGRGATFVLPDGFLIPKNIPEEADEAEGTDGEMAISNFAEDLHKRYAYVTNSDLRNGGGESGSIFFSPDGQPLAYLTVLDNADEPSGSGTTPWGTYIACEDNDEDEYKIWEVDPFGRREAAETVLGAGGQFECAGFAYDDRDDKDIYFYMTQYDGDGPVRRYVPPRDAVNSKEDRAFRLLHAEGGTWEYLVFEPMEDETEANANEGEGGGDEGEGDGSSGTLRPISSGRILWTDDEALGRESAEEHFPRTRGIVRHGYQLFFASEDSEGSGGNGQGRTPLGGRIAVIDLDEWTYKAYDAGEMLDGGSPDEMVTLTKGGVGGGPSINAPMEGRNNHGHKGGAHRNFSSGSPILFVTDHLPDNSRDAGGGVVAFDPLDGSYRRIFRAEDNDNWVTGVAFSPDGTRMYAALVDGQNVDNPDLLYEVTRADGRGFGEM